MLHPWVELCSLRLGEERRKTEQTCPGLGPVALPETGVLRESGLRPEVHSGVMGKSPQERVSQAELQVRLLGTMDARLPGLGASEERVGGGGSGRGHPSRVHVGHTENTTHEDGAPRGGGQGVRSAKKGWGPRTRRDDRTPTRGGGREEGAGAQLGGGQARYIH